MTATEPSLTREERAAIAGKIKSLVLTKHVNVANPSQDYGPWTQEFDRRLDEVVAAPSRDAFENGVGSILQGLGSSHTAFYHKVGDRVPPQHAINASLRSMEIKGNRSWVFLNIIEDGPAHRAGIKDGDVLYSCDGKLAEPPNSPRFQLGGTHELQLGEIEGSRIRSVKVEVPNRAAKGRPPMIEPKSITYRVAAPGIGVNRTAGEVLGGANFRVGNGYYLRMPITGWYTWQGPCIEGTGVSPDVAVDVDMATLVRGKDVQIEKAIQTVATL
jgi:C-terminal processing protease CtpA/Prc